MSYYQLRSFSSETYVISKLDDDLNPESVYQTSATECTCPAGAAPTCRHRKMIPIFEASHHIDDGWLFCFERGTWVQPLAPMDDEPAFDDNAGHSLVEDVPFVEANDQCLVSTAKIPSNTPTTTETPPSTVASAPTMSTPPPAQSSLEGSIRKDGATSFRRRF